MRRYLPLLFALLALLVIGFAALQKEKILKNGRTLFVKLMPVDPRSLIQGDFMALYYKLNLSNEHEVSRDRDGYAILGYLLDVTLDRDSRVVSTRFVQNGLGESEQRVLLKVKYSPRSADYYPVSPTFLFAEGLAECYDKAEYAEIKVNEKGDAVLKQLVGKELQSLDCEKTERSRLL